MRVLLTSHFSLDAPPAGQFVAALAEQLKSLGHEVRVLTSTEPTNVVTSVSDDELNQYRDTLRRALDDEIAEFDPHIVHAQHVSLFGHLALEAGVPYVVTAWGDELDVAKSDPRFRRLAQEAAENAGRIFVASESLRHDVHRTFGDLDRQVVVACTDPEAIASCTDTLVTAYREVLVARFGNDQRP